MEVSENPEEITVETNGYAEDWDLTKSDMVSDIVWDSASAVERCSCKVSSEQVLEGNVHERKGET